MKRESEFQHHMNGSVAIYALLLTLVQLFLGLTSTLFLEI